MENLALQVGVIDHVKINDPERAHARGGKIKRKRRAQSAGADAEHARRLQFLLPIHANLRHDQMPRVAQDFVLVQCCRSFSKGSHRDLETSVR
jgi:hypothetical protein